ncbi:PQQ-binding-like beta-propeller repeat protein [Pseudonocardia xinjiangensis]|uniref:outer membrane protein assembly factor BamB family protein n=1 Tax=Pseudonocardia xinjiangensis TaxID=75289 RepID=UPI003D8A5981
MALSRFSACAAALVAVSALASCAAPAAAPPPPAPPAKIVLPAGAPGTPSWAPWPSALHDARHSGASTAEGPTNGAVRWRRKLEGAVTPGPVVGADGTIFVASNGGVLHALNPVDGTDRWTYDSGTPSGGDLSISPLVLPDGTVLFPADNRLIALSSTGQQLWSEPFAAQVTSPVTVDGKRVYVGDSSGTVTALDVSAPDGHWVAWHVNVGTTSYGSVVTDGNGRIYTTADSALVALDDQGASARVAWRSDPHDDITEVSAGLAPDGTALLGTNGSNEWAYRPDGTLLWKAPRVITYSSPAVTATGLAYVADHSGVVHGFDVRTGAETARYGPVPGQIWSSTIVDRAYRLYFGGQNGHAYGFDGGGRQLFDVDLGGPVDSYPALTADGALVIGSGNGFVTAIG